MRLLPTMACAVVAATALATTAEAGGSVAYFGLRGSIVQTDDGATDSGSINYEASYKDGYGAAAFLGWVLDDNFRLEAEAGVRSTDLDSVTFTQNDNDLSTIGISYKVDGHALTGTFMANLYYDIHCLGDIGVLPWVGVGVGGAYVEYAISGDVEQDFTTILSAKHYTAAMAYQAMAGITVPLGDSISGSIGYRFFQTRDFTYVDDFDIGFKTKLTQQSIDIGLQIHI